MKKGSIIIIVTVILALIVGVGGTLAYQKFSKKASIDTSEKSETSYNSPAPTASASPAVDPTATWKTYKIAQMSIKYPPTWYSAVAPTKELEPIGDNDSQPLISFAETGAGYDLKTEIALLKEHNFLNYSETTVQIDGKKAVRLSGTSQMKNEGYDLSGIKYIIYLVDFSDHTFNLSYAQTPDRADYSKEFELMVSTVKFTK